MRRLLDRAWLRLRSLFRGADVDAAMKDEIRVHLAEQIDEYVAAGMSLEKARQKALRDFGPMDGIEEACRDTRRVALVENLFQDLRYSLRSLIGQPMLLLAATLSIAAAIGANTTIFSVATSLMFATPSARQPDRLVHIRMGSGSHVSLQQWRDLEESHVLAGLTGFDVETSVNWRHGDSSVSVAPLLVAGNFFDVVAPPMALGRGFTASEAVAERDPTVAVISHGFWQGRLGSKPDIVGSALTINGRPYTVAGVLAPDLRSIIGFGLAPEIYLPLSRALSPDLDVPNEGAIQLVGRLADGQSLAEGRAATETVARRLVAKYGNEHFGRVDQFALAGSLEQLGSLATVGLFFAVLLVAVGLVLAIACANVAGLLLARATVRAREIAVRVALGASRRRLVQQLLTEGFWIATAGTLGGLVLMKLMLTLLSQLPLPLPLPFELSASIDWRLLAYAMGLTLATTLLSAVAPALQATKRSQWSTLRQGDGRSTRRFTMRNVLVVGQLAVALVLLVTASLFLRSLARARSLDPGFDTRDTMVAMIGFVEGRYTDDTRTAWLESAAERLRALPGVRAAGYAVGAPLTVRSGMSVGGEIRVESTGRVFQAGFEDNFAGPGYFEAIGIPVVKGRTFRSEDRRGAPGVAVVNEEFARRYFPGADLLGQRLLLPDGGPMGYPVEIVGIVGNSKHRSIGEDQRPALYEAYAQRSHNQRIAHLFVRTTAGSPLLPADVARPIGELDRSAAVDVKTMTDALGFAFMPSRLGAAMLGALGLLGVVLAMGGLFAVVSFSVSRRTGEIGIRMALGATPRQVTELVLRDAVMLTALGVTIGGGIAWFVTQPLAMFLVGGLAGDPIAFVSAALLLVVVSLIATLAPARRAVRIDPVAALRCD